MYLEGGKVAAITSSGGYNVTGTFAFFRYRPQGSVAHRGFRMAFSQQLDPDFPIIHAQLKQSGVGILRRIEKANEIPGKTRSTQWGILPAAFAILGLIAWRIRRAEGRGRITKPTSAFVLFMISIHYIYVYTRPTAIPATAIRVRHLILTPR
jgi:hypothetical protein